MSHPALIETLLGELRKFPGVGRRGAERMAYDLLSAPTERRRALIRALEEVDSTIAVCKRCGYFRANDVCLPECDRRDQSVLLVVEGPLDVVAIENAGGFRGLYHVLGGHLSPLKGIGPEDLRLEGLFERLDVEPIRELILATSPSVEGDATALYIAGEAEREGLSITRLARGMPMGGSLEFSDAGTLRQALEGRRALNS